MIKMILFLCVLRGGVFSLRIDISQTTTTKIQTTETTTTTASSTVPTTFLTSTPVTDPETSSTTSSTEATTKPTDQNSTTSPTSTTIKPRNETIQNTTISLLPIKRRTKFRTSSNYFCRCDLTVNICDLNCCCDIDCNKYMISSFQCDLEDDIRLLEDYGLPSCDVSSSLFCVIKNNLIEDDDTIFDTSLMKTKKAVKKWPSNWDDAKGTHRDTYTFNDDLLLYNELTESIEQILLPINVFGRNCLVSEAVKFMHNSEATCDRIATNLKMEELLTNITNFKIVNKSGSNAKLSPGLVIERQCENQFCVLFESFLCTNTSFSNRSCEALNSTDHDFVDLSSMISHSHFEFVHNFTHLKRALVYFIGDQSEVPSMQKFVVNFIPYSENDTDFYKTSGNIGYQNRLPVIISKFREVNISDSDTAILIEYFDDEFNNVTKFYLPSIGEGGDCNNQELNTVNFGENFLQKCNINPSEIESTNAEVNFTKICRSYQLKIFETISILHSEELSKIYVSTLGNPVNNTNSWTRLESSFDLNKVNGEMSDENFICRSMAIDLHFNFYFAKLKVGRNNIHLQNTIKKASLDIGPNVDLQFSLKEDIKIPVTFSAMFYDLTRRVKAHNGKGVNQFNIKLIVCSFVFVIIYLK